MDRLSILHLFFLEVQLADDFMSNSSLTSSVNWLIMPPTPLSWCCFHSSKYICRYLDVPFKELFKKHGGLEFFCLPGRRISLSIQPKVSIPANNAFHFHLTKAFFMSVSTELSTNSSFCSRSHSSTQRLGQICKRLVLLEKAKKLKQLSPISSLG